MIAAVAYTAVITVLAGCIAYGTGHQRLDCLRSALGIRALIITARAAIAAVWVARVARHPLRYAGYLRARVFRRIPGLDPDGESLKPGEWGKFLAVVEYWKHPAAAERSRT